MRNLVLTALIASTASAASASQIKLFDRATCMKSYIKCDAPTQFLHDTEGRCGCLKAGDFIPVSQCAVSFIECEPGTTLSHLKDKDANWVGCGCYATARVRY